MKLNTRQSDFLRDSSLVAFDCETTGMWAISHRMVELAGVKFSLTGRKTEVFHSLINPGMAMPSDVIAVHGITDEMVIAAPRVQEVIPKFMAFCADSVLVAHNARFDISFLTAEMNRNNIPGLTNTVLDSCELSRRYLPGLRSYSLLNVCRHLRIAEAQEHRALADALLVKRLFTRLAKKIPLIISREELRATLCGRMQDYNGYTPAALPERFGDIAKAIDLKMPMEITYHRPGATPHARLIEPKQTFAHGPLLYLSAFCYEVMAERTFRIDRILSFKFVSELAGEGITQTNK